MANIIKGTMALLPQDVASMLINPDSLGLSTELCAPKTSSSV